VVPPHEHCVAPLLILHLIIQTDGSPWVRPDSWEGPEVNYLEDLGEEIPKYRGTGAIRSKGKKKAAKKPYASASRFR
jgi:hypothetical protein